MKRKENKLITSKRQVPEPDTSEIDSLGKIKKPNQFLDTGLTATYYYGFDISIYPGDSQMSAFWRSTPFWYTGFYLAPSPSHSFDSSWMDKRTYLKTMGYGFLVIYAGRQENWSNLTTAQGQTDADQAISLAQQAGFPNGTYIFLDIENGGDLTAAFLNYISGWVNRVNASTSPYWSGIYCSFWRTADQIRNHLSGATLKFWCYNINVPPSPGANFPTTAPDPTGCGVSFASAWQFVVDTPKTYNGVTLTIDVNTATSQNPSSG